MRVGTTKRVENCLRKVKKGDLVHVHYKGMLRDTKEEFDNSYEKGSPIEFIVGQGHVILGLEEGVKGMCFGEKRRIHIPTWMAYGPEGYGDTIPPDADLIFDVEMMAIQDPVEQEEL